MVKNFKRGFKGVKFTLNKLKVLCEVDWTSFGVEWPPEGSLNKTVVNEVYRVIVKQTNKKQNPNLTPQRMGKAKRLKLVFKNQTLVYLNSGSNLLGGLRRNQSLPVLMGSFGAPVCTSSPKMGILKKN
jgi:trafficking kinesin-binding protein 2